MPHVQLYINNQLCDLIGDEAIEVDYSIFDISKIGKRGGARSYEFELPKTNRNKTVLENPEIVNNLSRVPYTRLSAKVIVDGLDMLIRFCEVSSAGATYKIRLYGSNSDLFATLSERKLWDLDLSDYDHIWEMPVVYASRENTEGVIYAIIDYHEDSPNFAINNDNYVLDIRYMPPSIFINTILNKIIEGTGYTFVNELASDSAPLIMPLHFVPGQQGGEFIAAKYNGIFSEFSDLEVIDSSTGTPIQYYFPFDAVSSYAGTYYDLPYHVPGTTIRAIKLEDRINLEITFSFDVTFQTNVNFFNILFTTYDNTGAITQTFNLFNANNYTAGTHTITQTLQLTNVRPVQRETYFSFGFINQGGLFGDTSPVIVENTSTVTISNTVPWSNMLKYGNFLPITALMPDMTQVEFVKNYMLLFGILPIVDDTHNTVTFKRFDSILGKLGNSYDWSNLVDHSEEPEVSYMLNNYAQNNLFKWEQDGEEIVPEDTNGNIQISNGNMELEKDLVEMDFASTYSNLRLFESEVPQIGIYRQGEWTNDKMPRILYVDYLGFADCGTITYTDDSVTQAVSDSIPMCHFIHYRREFNLGFGNNLLGNYYTLLTSVIGSMKIVKVYLRLNASIINQLDISRPVFIQGFEAYFYISSIKAFTFTESKSTLVELVKLNING